MLSVLKNDIVSKTPHFSRTFHSLLSSTIIGKNLCCLISKTCDFTPQFWLYFFSSEDRMQIVDGIRVYLWKIDEFYLRRPQWKANQMNSVITHRITSRTAFSLQRHLNDYSSFSLMKYIDLNYKIISFQKFPAFGSAVYFNGWDKFCICLWAAKFHWSSCTWHMTRSKDKNPEIKIQRKENCR